MEEADLWLKTTFKLKMTFGGRRPLMEDDLVWKTTIGGRQPSLEDDLWWKATFGGRQLSGEDNLQWKTTFDGRRLSVVKLLSLTITAQLLLAVSTGN